jgi:cytochrome c
MQRNFPIPGVSIMTSRIYFSAIAIVAFAGLSFSLVPSGHAQGNAQRGAKAFQTCAACHSLDPRRNLTGPSLANLFGRKVGTAPGFLRYSDALKRSDIVWNEQTLDAWLKAPDEFIPGNDMAFPGIKDDKARRDLIAYLKAADSIPGARQSGQRLPSLKKAKPGDIVKSIRHCGDTYFVNTEDGNLYKIWEFNLRFKTDTGDSGPARAKPVILGQGMRGDRAAIVFASPAEFSAFIKQQCD